MWTGDLGNCRLVGSECQNICDHGLSLCHAVVGKRPSNLSEKEMENMFYIIDSLDPGGIFINVYDWLSQP